MWQCVEYTKDVHGVTGKAEKEIIFWTLDSNRRKVHQVKVPTNCIPVFKIGKA